MNIHYHLLFKARAILRMEFGKTMKKRTVFKYSQLFQSRLYSQENHFDCPIYDASQILDEAVKFVSGNLPMKILTLPV